MVEAIQEFNNKDKNPQEAILALQEILNNTPAGLVKPNEQQPSCTSIQDIQTNEKSNSIETASEPSSGRLEAISNTNSKKEATESDNQTNKENDQRVIGNDDGNGTIDQRALQDGDGDGIPDSEDKNPQTRGETSNKKNLEFQEIAQARKAGKLETTKFSSNAIGNVKDNTNINEQIATLFKKQNNIGTSLDSKDKEDDSLIPDLSFRDKER